jgi:outer membrane biosynthesis protein TonB
VAGRVQPHPLSGTLLVALMACAHAPAETQAPAAKKPLRIEAGENQTDPVRKSCKSAGPEIAAGETVSGIVRATYLVGADGKVTDVKVTGKGSAGALQSIQRFIASCTYAPARRDGKPVAVRWRGDLDFSPH